MLVACGGGNPSSSASNPIFTSLPETQASQDTLYTYQLAAVDPAGATVTFSLTTAPNGATLGGNTLSWTPAASQSRVSNTFAVTARTPSGGSAMQSWTVTPNGTITVKWVDTYWSPSGPVAVAALASAALNMQAMVTQRDGSIGLLPASATSSPGVFTIANVPAGSYWLAPGRGGAFWTSTGAFDAGRDIAGGQTPFTKSSNNTSFNLNFSGVAPAATQEYIQFFTDPPFGGLLFTLPAESDNLTSSFSLNTNVDWSQINTAFLLQYEPETLVSEAILKMVNERYGDLSTAALSALRVSRRRLPLFDLSLACDQLSTPSVRPLLPVVTPDKAVRQKPPDPGKPLRSGPVRQDTESTQLY
jgi:hypothetical protein